METSVIEHVSFEELTKAYFDCRKRKRNKKSAMSYELNYEENNYDLWLSLNNDTYEVGKSIRFCVTRPKLREIFAADFRDRIVHHLLMNRMLQFFEEEFIDDTYNCRVGKGVLYGANRLEEQINEVGKDGYCLCLDLNGFFMTIDKDILWNITEQLIRNKWNYTDDVEWWLQLLKKVIYNRPELNCVEYGDLSLFDKLPFGKSLAHTNGKGLPIGNLTSQILANFYLTIVDKYLVDKVDGYGRYVDDLRLVDKDKSKLLKIIPQLRMLLGSIGLKLNEKKTQLQRTDKGVPFIGYIIKPWGKYIGKTTKRNAFNLSYTKKEKIERLVCRVNSYFGFMKHTLSYALRYKIWLNLSKNYSGIFGTNHLFSIKRIKNKTK